MNQMKIGKFISETRKEQGMTQKQLAELLNVSDKTISKWECGNGMPDNSNLLELCNVLHININELLSGERLSTDNYHEKAEENMIQLIHKSEKEKHGRKWSILALLAETYFVLVMFILSTGGLTGIINFLDFPSLLAILAITFLVLTLSGSLGDFFRCFSICFRPNHPRNETEIKHALHAMHLALITIPLSGFFFTLVGVIAALAAGISDMVQLSANLAVASLSTLYGVLLTLLLLPMEAKLKRWAD